MNIAYVFEPVHSQPDAPLYNVGLRGWVGAEQTTVATLGAYSQSHAQLIADVINSGAGWVQREDV